jgi:hypothetical protein
MEEHATAKASGGDHVHAASLALSDINDLYQYRTAEIESNEKDQRCCIRGKGRPRQDGAAAKNEKRISRC